MPGDRRGQPAIVVEPRARLGDALADRVLFGGDVDLQGVIPAAVFER